MSCHDIGRGMNSVVQVTINLFDKGKISLDAAREIIHACRVGVYWCDGNEYEAVESIRNCRCGRCLRKVEKGDIFINTYEFYRYRNDRDLPKFGEINKNLASLRVCRECFIQIVNDYYQKEDAGEEILNYFFTILGEDEYICDGE